ncbi:hypothetical protein LINPERPRIM_LOCUS37282 [Linum perenne]
MEEASTSATINSDILNALKRKSNDVGWQYGTLSGPLNTDKVKCNFCKHASTGGIYCLKAHIGNFGNFVKGCKVAPPEAVQVCKSALEVTTRKKKNKIIREQGLRKDVIVSSKRLEEDIDCVGSSTPHKLGSIDKWTRPIDPKLSSTAELQQQRTDQALWQERTHQVYKYIVRWVYTHVVSFNAIENDEFKQLCEDIGQFRPGLKPPT